MSTPRILLAQSDPAWSVEFAELRQVYLAALGELLIGVEHVGSTAVPGLVAKPILDIDLVTADDAFFPRVKETLAALGYTHEGDQGIPQREVFKRADATVPRTASLRQWMDHHLYVCAPDSAELDRHLRFRDALREQSDLRVKYAALKDDLAQRANQDRKTYALLKEREARDWVYRVVASHRSAHPQPKYSPP